MLTNNSKIMYKKFKYKLYIFQLKKVNFETFVFVYNQKKCKKQLLELKKLVT